MRITAMQEAIKAALAQVSLAMDIAKELDLSATHSALHSAQVELRETLSWTEVSGD